MSPTIQTRSQHDLFDEGDPLTPRVDWDRRRLEKEWRLWNEREKDEYRYWLDLAKTVEAKDDLDFARFAAYRVLVHRRRVGASLKTKCGWRFE
jgi:hypothetical protein